MQAEAQIQSGNSVAALPLINRIKNMSMQIVPAL